ncbi:protocatechuate 3,4-dioxygenase subunit alpha [Actinobacteria bacterium YIM 96077]|uniref:Protocatechuate 3,4-dioxygenase subunit alpha n=2 Tax=Phytoactinopolyspora halophila TaxID=1981511 RepID=A0A329QQ31_9ACTN|nr:protocatechuate 3,4-dioxygenase subunit alpha [Actinobacteria bacterium YIM 96077]RAW14021.1 protocatechuate 3,4-dioxygenase subunit alpha [Phytoactinopolyspora halophila]
MVPERRGLTPSQTVGPFLHVGLPWPDGPHVVPEGTPGAVWITGTVYDGDGVPIPDAVVETWQADPEGRFDHPDDPRGSARSQVEGFRGFGRCPTDEDGRYAVHTVRPGSLPCPDGSTEAPHVNVSVLGRGLLDRVVTRIYFPGDDANHTDPVLCAVPEERRHTLIAAPDGDGFRFDIWLQGDRETVFFAL